MGVFLGIMGAIFFLHLNNEVDKLKKQVAANETSLNQVLEELKELKNKEN